MLCTEDNPFPAINSLLGKIILTLGRVNCVNKILYSHNGYYTANEIRLTTWSSVIVQCIRVCLPSCSPKFNPQAQHLCFLNSYLKCDENKTKITKKRPGLVHLKNVTPKYDDTIIILFLNRALKILKNVRRL